MNPDPTPTPPIDPAEPPKQDEAPAWAQQLIDQNADLTNRITAFEEKLQPPEPEAPPTPEPPSDEWKPQSWQDVDARAEEKAKSIVEQTLADRDAQLKAASDEETAAAQEVDKYLDTQITELTNDKKLPAVTNENDPNDPGKLAQRELYGYALSLGTADLKGAYTSLDALHQAGKQFDFVKTELVDKNPAAAGANSPVGSSNAGGSGTSSKPDYATIHNNSLDALAARFGNQ